MATDITRQLSASAYMHPALSGKIIEFSKNPFNAIVQPPGIDSTLLLKHALNAKNKEKSFNWLIFLPSVGLFVTLPFLPISFCIFIFLFIVVIIRDQTNKQFIKDHFTRHTFKDDFDYNGSGQELIKQFRGNSRAGRQVSLFKR